MSQFTIQWESKVKREIGMGTQWSGDVLLLDHNDLKGFSLFDPVERRELWEFRPKGGGCVTDIHAGGDRVWATGTRDVYAVRRSTGQGGPVENLKPKDIFRFASDTHAIFMLSKGAGILELATGEASRHQDAQHDLIPVAGSPPFFLAKDRAENYQTGQLDPGSGRLLKENAQPLEVVERGNLRGVYHCPAAFAFGNRAGEMKFWIYSWSGELLMAPEIPDFHMTEQMGVRAKFLLSPDGTMESLLIATWSPSDSEPNSRIFLLDLKEEGKLHWTTEIEGYLHGTFPILGKRLLWSNLRRHDENSKGMSMNLEDGSVEPFIEEPIWPWMVSNGRGLFFGKYQKGPKHIAYGEFI